MSCTAASYQNHKTLEFRSILEFATDRFWKTARASFIRLFLLRVSASTHPGSLHRGLPYQHLVWPADHSTSIRCTPYRVRPPRRSSSHLEVASRCRPGP